MALGSTKWETAMRVVLPAARVGIFGACVLALGRALGETIAVTMVIGNRPEISSSLFAPSYTLASVIANEFTEATTSIYTSALIELGHRDAMEARAAIMAFMSGEKLPPVLTSPGVAQST